MEAVDQEEQLARIADALESVSSFLSEISISLDKTLDGCILVSQNGKSRYLCISGDVYTN